MAGGSSSPTVHVGIGFGGALTLLFVTLRLTGFIDWPWLWVLAPLWIPAAIAALIVLACVGLWFAFGRVDARAKDARRRAQLGVPQRHQHGPAARWRRRS